MFWYFKKQNKTNETNQFINAQYFVPEIQWVAKKLQQIKLMKSSTDLPSIRGVFSIDTDITVCCLGNIFF